MHLLNLQGHDWNRRAGLFSASFELFLLRGDIYLLSCSHLGVWNHRGRKRHLVWRKRVYTPLLIALLSNRLVDGSAGICDGIYTICGEGTKFSTSFLDVCLLLFRVCGTYNFHG